MPIKYVGRRTTFKGKTLWEIVGNLKNFGVGRMVVRSQYERYPEPSYMRVLKVAALPRPENKPGEERKVVVLAEKAFRGVKSPKPVQIESTSYKADYILIPKDSEDRYLQKAGPQTTPILPKSIDFPPLYKEMILHRAELSKTLITDDLRMIMRYNKASIKNYRVAKDGETPTVKIEVGLGTPVTPSLYPHISKADPS